eukprot:12355881-Alexandrium_andersonii.AAC.1
MSASLVGSEMCIRDRTDARRPSGAAVVLPAPVSPASAHVAASGHVAAVRAMGRAVSLSASPRLTFRAAPLPPTSATFTACQIGSAPGWSPATSTSTSASRATSEVKVAAALEEWA